MSAKRATSSREVQPAARKTKAPVKPVKTEKSNGAATKAVAKPAKNAAAKESIEETFKALAIARAKATARREANARATPKPEPAPVETKSKPPKATPAEPKKARAESATKAETKGTEMTESAKAAPEPPAKKSVVRIARGMRTPKNKPQTAAAPTQETAFKTSHPTHTQRHQHQEPAPRVPGPRIEVNPRLESSKHVVNRGSSKPEGKPMSVAQKNRAAAEAVFARLTVPGETPKAPEPREPTPPPAAPAAPVNGVPEQPLPFAARKQEEGGGGFTMRISERDSLTTALRLSSNTDETLQAAIELADRYRLPPDQSLLLKVINLGDERLTKLALEEMLELEDRGRVRASTELKNTLGALKSKDPETDELRQLLLEKIGG